MDHVILKANCNPPERNAVILVINENPAVPGGEAVGGALSDSCGAWETVVFAHTGDRLDITYLVDQAESLPTTVIVP